MYLTMQVQSIRFIYQGFSFSYLCTSDFYGIQCTHARLVLLSFLSQWSAGYLPNLSCVRSI